MTRAPLQNVLERAPRPRFLLCGRGWTYPRRPLGSHCPSLTPTHVGLHSEHPETWKRLPSSPPSREPQRGGCPRSSWVSLSGSQGSRTPRPRELLLGVGQLGRRGLEAGARGPGVSLSPGWECRRNRAGDRRAPGCPGEPRPPQHSNCFKPIFSEHLNPQTTKGWRKGRGSGSWESLVSAGPGSLLGASAGLSLPCAPPCWRAAPSVLTHATPVPALGQVACHGRRCVLPGAVELAPLL